MQFPQAEQQQVAVAEAHAASDSSTLPDDPALQSSLPEAHPVPMPKTGVPVKIVADKQLRTPLVKGSFYTLDGHAVIWYRDYVVHADHITYNDDSGDITAEGHMIIDGGPHDEHFEATHGTVNVQQDTGHFYDVAGTVGLQKAGKNKVIYTSPNPYALTGKEIFQLGPGRYRVLHGSMTSCRLPNPDWNILSGDIEVDNGKATTHNAVFQLLRVPLLYLPYANHAVAENMRQSGILMPYFGNNTSKGLILGEGFYLTLGRSADLTGAAQYYSKRGFAPNAMFRYRGRDQDFANVRFHSLLDRGCHPPACATLQNQGGIDLNVDGRYDLSPNTRAVIDTEYLSSYLYRLVFEESYAIAINSEVKSQAFITHNNDDVWESIRTNRYQNFQSSTISSDEVRILHLPQIDVDAADHFLGKTSLMWGYSGSAGALSRFDYPNFRTTAEVPRTDISPRLSLPLHLDGWNFRPEFEVRETWYGKSQDATGLDAFPTVRSSGIDRVAVETGFDFRPPALERDFTAPWLQHLLGGTVRHVLEPDIQYRYVTGINNFRQILRFDDVDVASNTNEVEYSLTQRWYLKQDHPRTCRKEDTQEPESYLGGSLDRNPEAVCNGSPESWLSWTVAQKYFFDAGFDHAITPHVQNPLLTTLDFSGVDFLTSPRHYSPVISRLHAHTTAATDVEWDVDYDTKTGRLLSSNIYAAYRMGDYHLQFGDAYLNSPAGTSPGTSTTSGSATTTDSGTSSATTSTSTCSTAAGSATSCQANNSYNQIHLAAIYGSETKLGFSGGMNAAYDLVHEQLQFGAVQAAYNLNCCGLTVQWRKFSLGSIRDDTEYFYSLNFSGFTSLGNLAHHIRLF